MKALYSASEIRIALNRNLFSTRQNRPRKKHWSNLPLQHCVLAFESKRVLAHHREELCSCVRSDCSHINTGKSICELLQFARAEQSAIGTINCLRRVTADRLVH